jgi:hypothetical protein
MILLRLLYIIVEFNTECHLTIFLQSTKYKTKSALVKPNIGLTDVYQSYRISIVLNKQRIITSLFHTTSFDIFYELYYFENNMVLIAMKNFNREKNIEQNWLEINYVTLKMILLNSVMIYVWRSYGGNVEVHCLCVIWCETNNL